jgi:hypothetical protein
VSRASTERFNAATVCLSVRVSPAEAERLRTLAGLHGVTVQAILTQCVRSSLDVLEGVALRAAALAPIIVSAEDAARGGAPDHRLRLLAERATREP